MEICSPHGVTLTSVHGAELELGGPRAEPIEQLGLRNHSLMERGAVNATSCRAPQRHRDGGRGAVAESAAEKTEEPKNP